MRSGRRNTPVEFLAPVRKLDDNGEPVQVLQVVRKCWCTFEPFRGGELSLDVEVESQETAKFTFDFLDIMARDKRGATVTADMVMRMDGDPRFWDIDVIHPDLARKKSVEIMGVQKRLPV